MPLQTVRPQFFIIHCLTFQHGSVLVFLHTISRSYWIYKVNQDIIPRSYIYDEPSPLWMSRAVSVVSYTITACTKLLYIASNVSIWSSAPQRWPNSQKQRCFILVPVKKAKAFICILEWAKYEELGCGHTKACGVPRRLSHLGSSFQYLNQPLCSTFIGVMPWSCDLWNSMES